MPFKSSRINTLDSRPATAAERSSNHSVGDPVLARACKAMRDPSVRHSAHLSDIITRHVYLFANPSEFIHRNDDRDVTVTGNNGMKTVDRTIDR